MKTREKKKCLFRAIVVWPFSFCSFACVANFDARRLWASGAPAANSLRTGLTVEFLRNNSSKHPFLQNYNSVATINLFIFIFILIFFNSYFGAFVVQHIVYPFLFYFSVSRTVHQGRVARFSFLNSNRRHWSTSPDSARYTDESDTPKRKRTQTIFSKQCAFLFCVPSVSGFSQKLWLDDLLDVCPTAVSFFVTVDDEGLFFLFLYIFFLL